ncbi:hypothetical protein CYMTET_28970 [Cymbomonas tetramitiformis]|uniref:MI domain-containing protein n=1 Tax=Cymbomonas tetramitiformis TaxID=36881 RepID=A0AAE0KVD4_9CHLO|nr:hypothetical protein CYMTET_28970 [Cymbomonas tetramitiformis]
MSMLTEDQRAQMAEAVADRTGSPPTHPNQPRKNSAGSRRPSSGGGGGGDALGPVEDFSVDQKGRPCSGERRRNKQRGKADGSGARGTWGPMIDVVEPTTILDSGDPNYDSNEEPVTFGAASGLWETKYTDAIVEYKEQVSTCVEEYFNSADVNEALDRLEELGSPLYQHFIIKRAVTKAMDRGHREMEMTARLISAMHGKIVTVEESVKGFHQLLAAVEDLTIDVPEAPTILGTFIARGVVDDVLPPSFVTSSETESNPSASAAIKHCQGLLGARHAAERILQIWGYAVGMTVEVAKSKLAALLEEFLVSNDVAEAQRCLHELNLPFFHHELVKKAVFVALEKNEADEHVVFLLETLGSNGEISQNQLTMGLQRSFDALPDLSLDVPDAESHMHQLIEKMKAAK